MNQKTKILEELNKYVRSCKKWELPALRNQCVQMIRMIETRMYGKPTPIINKKAAWKKWRTLFAKKEEEK